MNMSPVFPRFLAIGLLLVTGCGEPRLPEPEVSKLIVGMDLSLPPFETTDGDGNPRGITVDMVRDLGTYLNVAVEIQAHPAEGLEGELREKRIDLMIPPLSFSPGDGAGLLSTEPFVWLGLALLTRPDRELASAEDLNQSSVTVAVIKGTIGQSFASTSLPHARVKPFEDEDTALEALRGGDVDAFVLDQLAAHRLAEEYPERLRAVLKPFRREPRVFYLLEERVGLRDDLNEFFEDYRQIGGFDRLLERHAPEFFRDFQEMDEALPFDPPGGEEEGGEGRGQRIEVRVRGEDFDGEA